MSARGVAAALLIAAASATAAPTHVELTLDWTPNPNHVGLYVARERGLFARAGLEVAIRAPSDPTAPLKLVGAGRSDLAISYEQELFFAAARQLPVVAVAAVVPRPLNSFMAIDPSIVSIRDLRGRGLGIVYISHRLDEIFAIGDRVVIKGDDFTFEDLYGNSYDVVQMPSR